MDGPIPSRKWAQFTELPDHCTGTKDEVPGIEATRGLGVPRGDIDEIVALTASGEPGIALENLCEQLFEYWHVLENKDCTVIVLCAAS